MNFSELESRMSSCGVTSLAEIARALNTTPQAVSNWKSRNQVPHHVVAKLSQILPVGNPQIDYNDFSIKNQKLNINNPSASPIYPSLVTPHSSQFHEEDTIFLSDILLTMAQQLKVIILVPFITVFLTFTYVQFIQAPKYVSFATILLPDSQSNNLGALGGLASQFGVNMSSGVGVPQIDLSSPSLYPELLRSRTFAKKILEKNFYLKKYEKKLSLLSILTHGDTLTTDEKEKSITDALISLENMLDFIEDPITNLSVIKVTTNEPLFSKELAEVVLMELDALNRFFKSETVNEKTDFINQRITSVENELKSSEINLRIFNEQNRQISSPALELEQDRFKREVEVQNGIFLTLKQQLELAKIEEVQKASIVQVLDYPQVPLYRSNKKLKLSVFMASFAGLGLGVLLGFIRAYINNDNVSERRKIRRIKNFVKKNVKDAVFDRRISGIVSLLFIIFLPHYFNYYPLTNPIFIVYIIGLIISPVLFIYSSLKKKKS
jgi:uncharacterized protein involved in exopolysaccharide biosynthesis